MLPTLSTPRLTLRPWSVDDVEAAFDIYSRWDVMRYLGNAPRVHADRSETLAMLERWHGLTGPLHGVWAIVPAEQSAPVGSALCKSLPRSTSGEPSEFTEIGWHLHPDAWGHGYASEAGQRLLDHAWEHGLGEVYAVTYPENFASQAVCRRLGMASLGLTEDYYDVSSALFRIERPAA